MPICVHFCAHSALLGAVRSVGESRQVRVGRKTAGRLRRLCSTYGDGKINTLE